MTWPARPVKKGGIIVAVLETNNHTIHWSEGRRYDHPFPKGCGRLAPKGCRRRVRFYRYRWISRDMKRIDSEVLRMPRWEGA